jgi:hypothetical protein
VYSSSLVLRSRTYLAVEPPGRITRRAVDVVRNAPKRTILHCTVRACGQDGNYQSQDGHNKSHREHDKIHGLHDPSHGVHVLSHARRDFLHGVTHFDPVSKFTVKGEILSFCNLKISKLSQ